MADVIDPNDVRAIVMNQIRRDDGSVVVSLVGEWPKITMIAPALLSGAMPDLLRVDGDTVRIIVANGDAEYRRVLDGGVWFSVFRLVRSSRTPAAEVGT